MCEKEREILSRLLGMRLIKAEGRREEYERGGFSLRGAATYQLANGQQVKAELIRIRDKSAHREYVVKVDLMDGQHVWKVRVEPYGRKNADEVFLHEAETEIARMSGFYLPPLLDFIYVVRRDIGMASIPAS